ncbi:MAG: SDR family oxidoreductase [Eubacteriales bacterium]|nr:SDR family oxidoreductase [Eubacteriales bacterium]
MGKLDGRVALITGCSSGIGKQIAIRYAEEGAKLAICARRMEKLEETARICREKGAEVLTVKVDIALEADLERLVEQTVERFGTVDILINNAMSGVPYTPLEEMPFDYFEHFVKTMLFSTVRLSQLCFPYMKGRDGSIINLGSSTSLGGKSDFYQSAYGTMKGAIAALTRCTASEWGKYGIRANLIYPIVATEAINDPEGRHKDSGILEELAKNPLQRVGDAYRDVAPVAVFLGSSESSYITGQALRAEGGRFMGVC